MQILESILLGIALSMDAFAVAICKGLSSEKFSVKSALIVGLWFGLFQALMPLAGYFLTGLVAGYIESIDHWIALALLGFIGGKMIYEAVKGEEKQEPTPEEEKQEEQKKQDASVAFKVMLPLAIGTSIDAMAAGFTLALESVNIFIAIAIIGVITFVLSAIGVKIGNIFGAKFKSKAEIFGGVVLILIGLGILIEHLFF